MSVLHWNEVHVPESSQRCLLWSEAEQVPRILLLSILITCAALRGASLSATRASTRSDFDLVTMAGSW